PCSLCRTSNYRRHSEQASSGRVCLSGRLRVKRKTYHCRFTRKPKTRNKKNAIGDAFFAKQISKLPICYCWRSKSGLQFLPAFYKECQRGFYLQQDLRFALCVYSCFGYLWNCHFRDSFI